MERKGRFDTLQVYTDYYEKCWGPPRKNVDLYTGLEYVPVNVGDQFHLGDGTIFEVLMFQERKSYARNQDVVCGYCGGKPIATDLQPYLDEDEVIVLCGDSVGSAIKRYKVPQQARIEKDFSLNPTYRSPFGPLTP